MKIIINGKEIETPATITYYDDIVEASKLPYRKDYTVTYSHPDKSGSIFHPFGNVGCKPVTLKEGMIFNITHTGGA